MADITYTREFTHEDWRDGEDIVQAGGEKGFNEKFHALEGEFDKIATVISQLSDVINQIQRLRWIRALPAQTLPSGQTSPEVEIEQYDQSEVPQNTQKVYFTSFAFVPPTATGQVDTYTYYRPAPNNTIRVFMQFKNNSANQVTFTTQVFSIS
jgi:hypothetical protein